MIQIAVWFLWILLSMTTCNASVNLALGRPADMSSTSFHTFPHGPDRAVDGNNDTNVLNGHCTHTREFMTTVWWRVQLNTSSTIQRIHIVYRTLYEDRLAGYSLYVTDEIIRSDRYFQSPYFPIFHDTGPALPNSVQTFVPATPVTGRFVSVYNNRTVSPLPAGYSQEAILELCEVEVYGCPLGRYGATCNAQCPANCQDGACHPDTGVCIYGCISGFRGTYCNEACSRGTFGPNCSGTCNCRTGTCDVQTGICTTPGCQAGWQGANCSIACNGGSFGEDCARRCFCSSGSCNRMSGTCSSPGCLPGYRGPSCSMGCPIGMFGPDCTQRCGRCQNGVTCDSTSGTCNGSCADGYTGDGCRQRCRPGEYGTNCTLTCGNCYNDRPCNHMTGSCRLQSGPICKGGFRGQLCTTPCTSNTFGADCASRCGLCNTFPCNPVNGSCPDGCSSQTVQGPACLPLAEAQTSSSTAVTAVLVVLSLLVLIALVIVGIILWKRYSITGIKNKATKVANQVRASFKSVRIRNRRSSSVHSNKSTAYSTRPRAGKEQVYINVDDKLPIVVDEGESREPSLHSVNPNYTNVTLGGIPVDQLPTVIQEMSENGNEGFMDEYQGIPYGEQGKCNVAKKSENIKKNRFKSIYPYDHSRVILRVPASDYINASFIDGIEKRKAYIASQGPKPDTVDDLWAMIWQENVTSIIMLTNLRESGKRKCHQYWPNEDDFLECNYLTITSKKEKKYSDFTIRYFSVMNQKTGDERQITQYHYTSWPDHGVPEELGLLQFHQVAKRESRADRGPLLVHCSAGIGRTGTFIALDALLKKGQMTGTVNIADFVGQMRENRMNMIQTLDQYIFLYKVLREGFRYESSSINKEEFLTAYQSMMEEEQPANMPTIKKQFQDLESCRPQYTDEDYKGAQAKGNSSKNRTSEPLPVDRFRPQLRTRVSGHNDYINAISMSTYTEADALFVTRYPPPNTEVDVWRLIYEYEIDTIILHCLPDPESVNSWMPSENENKACSMFSISRSDMEAVTNGISISTLTIKAEKTSLNAKLVELKFLDPASPLPTPPESVMKTIMITKQWRSSGGVGPMLYISPDGVSGIGVFGAVYNAVEQIAEDNEVDLYNIVRRMRARRPELIQTYDEYQSCFSLIREHLTVDNNRQISGEVQTRYENVEMGSDGEFQLEAQV